MEKRETTYIKILKVDQHKIKTDEMEKEGHISTNSKENVGLVRAFGVI